MSEFSDTLRKYIKNSNFTIYGIAKKLNIDRSSLQKVLSDKRPIKKNTLNKIMDELIITDEQRKELIHLYNKYSFGTEYHKNFQAIKNALYRYRNMSFYSKDFSIIEYKVKASDNNSDFLFFDNQFAVLNIIQTLLLNEAAYSESPKIYFNFNLKNEFIKSIIEKIFIQNSQKNDIKNIICFFRDSKSAEYNFDTFFTFFPMALYKYAPYIYYDDSNIENNISLIYPYYLITSNSVICFSADCESAVLFKKKELVDSYTSEFLKNFVKCKPLCNCFIKQQNFKPDTEFSEMLPVYYIGNVFCDSFSSFERAKIYLTGHTIITSLSAINNFIKTGQYIDVFGKPFFICKKQERCLIIKKLLGQIITDDIKFFFFDESSFNWPDNFNFFAYPNANLLFAQIFNNSSGKYEYSVSFNPPHNITGSLVNFFSRLTKTHYILGKDEVIEEIKNMLDKYASDI